MRPVSDKYHILTKEELSEPLLCMQRVIFIILPVAESSAVKTASAL